MKSDHLKKYWADVRAGLRPKPQREKPTSATRDVRVDSIRGGKLVVTLHDHGVLEMREPGRRFSYKISVAQCWTIGAVNAANQQRALVKKYWKEQFLSLAEARAKARREVVG